MAEIITDHGTFPLDVAAYSAGLKIAKSARTLEHERGAREVVYYYFLDHPDELVFFINVGWLKVEEIKDGVPLIDRPGAESQD